MAIFTRGISLWFKESSQTGFNINLTGATKNDEWGTKIPGLQEVGELQAGSRASAGYDKIEVTTLNDIEHKYIDGLMADAGDASAISFTMLYDPEVYAAFIQIAQCELGPDNEESKGSLYYVTIPKAAGENSVFEIRGLTSAKVNSATVNGAMTMSVEITPIKEIKFTK